MANTMRLNRPVIAITGSAGKSTTKEMIASILSTRWRIFKSVDNMNFYTHTRMYAKRIHASHKALVLEYGISGAGHLRLHCQAIEPNYAVITNIGSAHLGAFGGDVRRLAYAKSELIRWMKPTGTVVLNNDDKNTKLISKGRFRGKTLTVGIDNAANYRATNVRYTQTGMAFNTTLRGKVQSFSIPIFGRHHVYNALSAIAIADSLGFTATEIRVGLRRYLRMRRRMTMYRLANKVVLIDDSYSSNPHAVKAALDTMKHIGKGRKIAVLGSMLALGKYTVQGHAEVGRHVARQKINQLYTFGHLAKRIGTAAINAGMPIASVAHFENRAALHRKLLQNLQPNTTILVKASHGVQLTQTADFLRARLSVRGQAKKTPQRRAGKRI